jgi:F-type H+-transporting ATPase subunit b
VKAARVKRAREARSGFAGVILGGAMFFGVAVLASFASAQAPHDPPAPRPNAPAEVPTPRTNPPVPRAADPHAPPLRMAAPSPGQPAPGAPQPGHGAAPVQHGAAPGPHGPAAGHGESGHGESGHGEHAEHDEKAPPPPINWWHGLLGEKANEPPSILWREPGEPPPFLASLINFGVLLLVVNRYGRKALADALVKRKENITREIDEATRLRRAAEERLVQYEKKLEKINDELERVRREFREQGERDKERIIREAKERRERMQKDTAIILSQEAKQLRHELLAEVVAQATRIATEILSKNTTLGDHDRFAEAFLSQLRSNARFTVPPAPPVRGGSSYPGPAAAKGNPS